MTTTNSSWIFPDVRMYADVSLDNPAVKTLREQSENQMEIYEKKIAERDEEIKQLKSRLDEISSQHESNLQSLALVVEKINSTVPEINTKFKKTVDSILNDTAQKFLFSEMSKNSKILKNIINKIIAELDAKKIAVIEVSAADYATLNVKKLNNTIKLQENDTLNRGEMLVQYNDQILMMKLSDIISAEIEGCNNG